MALENSDHKETSSTNETLEKLRALRSSMRLINEQKVTVPIVQTNERVKEQISAILLTTDTNKEATSNFEVEKQLMEKFLKELLEVNSTRYVELRKECNKLFYISQDGILVFKSQNQLRGTEMSTWRDKVKNVLDKIVVEKVDTEEQEDKKDKGKKLIEEYLHI